MLYANDVIEDVRTGNNIVDVVGSYVSLKKSGTSLYVGLCPFHKEHTPSFSVNEDKQLFYCFGCGVGGNVINFISREENLGFVESLEFLAKRIGYKLPEETLSQEENERRRFKERLYDMHKAAARFFYTELKDGENAKAAGEYLDKRGMTRDMRVRFGIGASPSFGSKLSEYLRSKGFTEDEIIGGGLASRSKKNGKIYDRFSDRLMFPIIDVSKRVIGFGGRILGDNKDTAKYLNSPETPIFSKSNNLYGLNFAYKSGTRKFILVEGYMDVIALAQAGFENAVAALGTAFNENHAKVLRRYADGVILLFDSDGAGEKAALRAIPQIKSVGLEPQVLQVKDAKDPDEYIKKFGAGAFAELLKTAKDSVTFRIDIEKRKFDINDTKQKVDFSKETARIIAEVKSPIEREVYVREAAKKAGVSEEALAAEIEGISKSAKVYGFNSSKRYRKNEPSVPNNAYIEAQKSVIGIFAATEDKAVKAVIRRALTADKFKNSVCARLFGYICEYDDKNVKPPPGELINKFDDDEAAQKTISEIFMKNTASEDSEGFMQALADHLYTIEKNYIHAEMSGTEDTDRLSELIKMQKKLNDMQNSGKDRFAFWESG